jgi:hypothetical protein
LVSGEKSEFSSEGAQMELGNLLVEFLGEYVDLTLFIFIIVFIDPEIDLSDDLVGE